MRPLPKHARSIGSRLQPALTLRLATALLAFLVAATLSYSPLHAQTRAIGAGSLVLDDNAGHKIAIMTPQPGDPGYAQWAAGGPLIWKIPIPPVSGEASAFVLPGPGIAGSTKVLIWDPPAPAGTGGYQGVWRPVDASTIAGVMGSGTPGAIPRWTSSGAIGNSIATDDGTTLGIAGNLSTTGSIAATGNVSLGGGMQVSVTTSPVASNATTLDASHVYFIIPANGGTSVNVTLPPATAGKTITIENRMLPPRLPVL